MNYLVLVIEISHLEFICNLVLEIWDFFTQMHPNNK